MLGSLPLALAQAASYMDSNGSMPVSRFLTVYRTQTGEASVLAKILPDYPESLATTWLLHFRALQSESPAALELLQLLAFVGGSTKIRVDLFLSRPDLLRPELAGHLRQASLTEVGREETVGRLVRAGLALREGDDFIRVHPMVSAATRRQLGNRSASWAHQVIRLLAELIPQNPWEHRNWLLCRELVSHVVAAADHSPHSVETATALLKIGQYLAAIGQYQEALGIIERAYQLEVDLLGPDHQRVAVSLTNLGNAQLGLERHEAALASLTRALELKERHFGAESTDVAVTLTNLGRAQRQSGRLDEANKSLERACRLYPSADPRLVSAMTNLGIVQRDLEAYAEAKKSFEGALRLGDRLAEADPVRLANALSNLGGIQAILEDLAGARANLERALKILAAIDGAADHPHLAETLLLLADVTERLGDRTAALGHYRQALKIFGSRNDLQAQAAAVKTRVEQLTRSTWRRFPGARSGGSRAGGVR